MGLRMAVFRRLPGLAGLGWPWLTWLAVVLVFMLAFIGHVLESRAFESFAFCVLTEILDLRCSEMLLEGVDMIGVVFDLAGVVSLLFISGLLL